MKEKDLLGILSTNIRQYRLRGKLSQAALAEKADISINFLSDIETVKKWPSPQTMIKLAKVFNIEVYELLKPEGILPDNSGQTIAKYTEEILATINKSVGSVQNKYMAKLKRRS
jgi:transcriptional regulator with XRE-family HTH domain